MARYCHQRGCETRTYDDDEFMCPDHNVDLLDDPPPVRAEPVAPPPGDTPSTPAAPTPPTTSGRQAADPGRSWRTATCWACGTPSPNPANTLCLTCPEALVPPRLLLTWAGGAVRLNPGESVELGREGPHARIFRDHGNVSRRHATVVVDDDGTAWVEPLPAVNGTFRVGAADGETLRFARDVTATVAVYALPDR